MAKDEKVSVEKAVRDIHRETRRKHSAEENLYRVGMSAG
jgi:hypothetical protein